MWAKIVSVLLGFWLIISPTVTGMAKAGNNNNFIIGPLVITFSVIALWQINRNVIKANYVVAGWLFIAPIFIEYDSTIGLISNIIAAMAIILLAWLPSPVSQSYGGGWTSLWSKDPEHARQQ